MSIYRSSVDPPPRYESQSLSVPRPVASRFDPIEKQIQALGARHDRKDRLKYIDFKVILIEKAIEKICKEQKFTIAKPNNDKTAYKTCLMNAASKVLEKVSKQDFKIKVGLDPEFRHDIERLSQGLEESGGWAFENEFAHLLLSPQFQRDKQRFDVDHWANLLIWVYDKNSLEEMAAAFEDL